MRAPLSLPCVIALALLLGGCQRGTERASGADSAATARAAAGISADSILRHVTELSSDAYEGRGPGTRGESLTVAYVTNAFRAAGLEPGTPDGAWLQPAELAAMRATATASFTVGGRTLPIDVPSDVIARVVSPDSLVVVDRSDVVFVGYGIVAPEYQWDDYAGLDVRGKTVVVLPNEPTPAVLRAAGRSDTTLFRGAELSYHGWTRAKRENALRHGAAALIMARSREQASGWASLLPLFTQEYAAVANDVRRENPVNAFMQWSALERLFAAAGRNLDSALVAAARPGFRGGAIGATASFRVALRHRTLRTSNIIARLSGSDETRRHEYVIYTGHWDAFGRDRTLAGDQIRNGAVDDGIGVGQMLETARAFAALPTRPPRTILFLVTTGEELGLLGARWYALNPLYPLDRTLADINYDSGFPWGSTTAVTILGDGRSTLDDVTRRVAAAMGKRVLPDANPAEGFYFRSDHFEFARVGVPSLDAAPAGELMGQPAGEAARRTTDYALHDYHRVSDEVKSGWKLSGDAEQARLGFLVGLEVARGSTWPSWKPGAEFRSVRDSMLAGKRL